MSIDGAPESSLWSSFHAQYKTSFTHMPSLTNSKPTRFLEGSLDASLDLTVTVLSFCHHPAVPGTSVRSHYPSIPSPSPSNQQPCLLIWPWKHVSYLISPLHPHTPLTQHLFIFPSPETMCSANPCVLSSPHSTTAASPSSPVPPEDPVPCLEPNLIQVMLRQA